MNRAALITAIRAGVLAFGITAAAMAPVFAQAAEEVVGPAETAETFEPANRAVYRAATAYRGTKIMVSTTERRLRLVVAGDTVLNVSVAVGMGKNFEFEGRKFRF